MWNKIIDIWGFDRPDDHGSYTKCATQYITNGFMEIIGQMKCELDINNLIIKKDLHLLNKYFNKIPFYYAIISYDGTIVRYNLSLSSLISDSMYRYETSDYIGVNLVECSHPNDINLFKDYLTFILNEDNPPNKESVIRMLPTNKKTIYVKWGATHLKDDQLILLFGQDITHEIEAKDKVREFIHRRNLMLNHHPHSIISTDECGIIREVNNCTEVYTGYKREDIVNKLHLFNLFPDRDLLNENKLGKLQRTEIRKGDGRTMSIYTTITSLIDDYKHTHGFLIVIHDEDYLNNI